MLAYPITAALLVASVAAETHPRVLKNDFLRAMTNHGHKKSQRNRRRKLSVKDFQAELRGDSASAMALRKKVFQKATFVKPGQESWREEKPTASVPAKKPANRRLENANYNNDYNGYNANGDGDDDGAYNGQNWQQDAQDNYQAQREYYNNNGQNKYNANYDGSDDYFQAYGEWENEFGFDVTQYSLSYARCASVKQYDDEIAATEDTTSVFATKRFAVFRFCPEMTCMGFNDNKNGNYECNEDYYGEDYCDYMEEYAEYYEELSNYQQQQQAASQKYGWMNNYGEGQNGDDAVEWEPEDQETWGANGEGCASNYGEYLIELEEYLEMMKEWQEERFETYCQYCEQCMYKVYEKWLQNGGNRKLSYEDFKASEEHRQLRQLSTEHRELGGYYGQCPEYDTCVEYQQMCGGGDGEFDDYLECTEVEGNNGRVAYVGPHCSEDGLTVTLGVYSDEYCNDYIGNGVNVANFIGVELDIEEDALKQYYNSAHGTLDQLKFINEDNVCIPCRKGDNMWEDAGYVDDDQGNQEVNYDNAEISEVCENLYEVSARCDKHYRSYNSRTKMMKYAQAIAQEDLSCDFIDSIVMGNYDEFGNVDMDNNRNYNVEGQPGWMGDNMYAQQYGHYITEVTPLQIFGLIMSILAVCILAMWSTTLHRSLSKSGPWRPSRGLRSTAAPANAEDLSRQNSGIVMGRSASNTSYYMS